MSHPLHGLNRDQLVSVLTGLQDFIRKHEHLSVSVSARIRLRMPADIRRAAVLADRRTREETLAERWRLHVASLRPLECECGQPDGVHDFLCPMFGATQTQPGEPAAEPLSLADLDDEVDSAVADGMLREHARLTRGKGDV